MSSKLECIYYPTRTEEKKASSQKSIEMKLKHIQTHMADQLSLPRPPSLYLSICQLHGGSLRHNSVLMSGHLSRHE